MDDTLTSLERAIRTARTQNDGLAEANYRRGYCRALADVNRVREAIDHGLWAKAYFESHHRYQELVHCLITLSGCYLHVGDPNTAFTFLATAEMTARSAGLQSEAAEVQIALGSCYGSIGQSDLAYDHCIRALREFGTHLAATQKIAAMASAATALIEMQRFVEAKALVYEGLELASEAASDVHTFTLMSCQAVVRSRSESAEDLHELIVQIMTFGEEAHRPAISVGLLLGLGQSFLDRAMAPQAVVYLEQARDLARRAGLQDLHAKSQRLLARTYRDLGRHQEASDALANLVRHLDATIKGNLDLQILAAAAEQEAELARFAREVDRNHREQILTNASHEMRTPLNGILGLSNALMATALSMEQRNMVVQIHEAGESLVTAISIVLHQRNEDSLPDMPLASGENRSSAPTRILVVEDNPINQMVVQNFLRKFPAEYVANGAEAVAVVQEQEFDLIFMDYQMPVMDGCEATREIRRLQEGTGRHTPIVAMTASVMDEDRAACMAAGMDGFLAKPLSKDSIISAIRRFALI